MKRTTLIAIAVLLVASVGFAQYRLKWQSVNSGGRPGSGTGYSLNASAGQPSQGTGSGTGYLAYWGFWYGLRVVRPPGAVGWFAKTDMPTRPSPAKQKNVKDGGALTYWPTYGSELTADSPDPSDDTGYIFALKGNGTYEFYRYNTLSNQWYTPDSIPATKPDSSKKKAVKKGSALTTGTDNKIYAFKGNNTSQFWCYAPALNHWTLMPDVLPGDDGKRLKEGAGAVGVSLAGTDYIYLLKGSGTNEFYRFDIGARQWETRNGPPMVNNKGFKNGSCLVYAGDDINKIYLLKGAYNRFYVYDLNANGWTEEDSLPLKLPGSTHKKKAKDGAALAYHRRLIYALKGGNTNEFWCYQCDSNQWDTLPSISGDRKVKGGGALAYAPSTNALYALKGNNTLSLYAYYPAEGFGARLTTNSNVMGEGALRIADCGLRIVPNPFTNTATVSYSLAKPGEVSLKLYDVTGKLVATLAKGHAGVGASSLKLQASSLAKGIYVLKFETEGYRATRKLIIE
jgi:hypothetical protein